MRLLMVFALSAAMAVGARAQVAQDEAGTATDSLTVERIFGGRDLSPAGMPRPVWLSSGRAYLETRPADGGGTDIIRVDAASGSETVVVAAAKLVGDDGRRFAIEDMQLSPDESRALLFHNSVRVWRANTRGVYDVVELSTGKLTPLVTVTSPSRGPSTLTDTATANFLGKVAGFVVPPLRNGLQMFAKFAPDSRHVAFVRDNDLFVTNLADGQLTRLTNDGSTDIINGTTDWVYEEELGLRDAFRWSPDSRSIAYWRFDQSPVPAFPMVDQQTLYPVVAVLRYPKAGMPNSRVRVGVISATGGGTTWLEAGPDTGQYIARMEWLGNDSVAVRRMPRKQDRMDLLLLSAASGKGRLVASDSDAAYVDVDDNGVVWIDGGKRFLMMSDRSGWRQVFLYDRAGRLVRQVTSDGADVLDIVRVDEKQGDVYVLAAAPTPIQRQVLKFPLDGKSPAEQVTTGAGTHSVSFNPTMTAMLDIFSSGGKPPVATLYDYPSMKVRRVLEDNAELVKKLAATGIAAPQFFRLPMPDGTLLDAYRLIPANFDSTQAHPVLMYVYGGPATPQVNDAWGGTRYLWHQLLTRHGYVIVVVDNRGAAWRGRDFRKITQYHLGLRESQDQMDAARWIGSRSWADSARIGIWGWSYGGFMTLMTAGRGGDLFRAAVCVAPVSDWHLYDTIYTERFMWTPLENPEGYETSSAQAYLDGLTARFLIVHGTGDDNVHPQNTMQVVNRLEARAFPFQMMLYPNRTHSISGGRTQVHLFDMLTRFILTNL
jgi:dipeptidyl-peptidase-4